MRHDAQHTLPGLVQRFQGAQRARWGGQAPSLARSVRDGQGAAGIFARLPEVAGSGLSGVVNKVEVRTVDVDDDAALARWHGVESASVRHDRPFALHRSLAALTSSVQHPSAWMRRVLLAAFLDDELVGVAELGLPLDDNTHLAEMEVNVTPLHHRRGVGRALHHAIDIARRDAGRTTVIGELCVPIGDPSSVAFAAALGFTSVHEEEHLVVRLPVDPVQVDALTRAVLGYEIVTWTGRCPDDHRATARHTSSCATR